MGSGGCVAGESHGARKRTRTSTTVRPLAPEASASANSAIRAQGKTTQAGLILGWAETFVNARGPSAGRMFGGYRVTSILRPECYTPPEKLCLRLWVGTADGF